ncbi:MAG: LamG domain-containing protein [Deltaproteobacteria bacterium]|nr:LamG domain-containing protein [Deltaproteobacteria bacterium]
MRALWLTLAVAAPGCGLLFDATETPIPRLCDGEGEDLVLCLDFEDPIDDRIAVDSSRTGASAELGAMVTQVVRAERNLAIRVGAGDSAVDVPEHPALAFAGPFTIELTVSIEGGLLPVLVDHRPTYQLDTIAGGAVRCSSGVGLDNSVVTNGPIPPGFHRITCVRDDKLRLYVDGLQQNQIVDAAPPMPVLGPTFFGSNRNHMAQLTGTIDSVRFWNRALTTPEIVARTEEAR